MGVALRLHYARSALSAPPILVTFFTLFPCIPGVGTLCTARNTPSSGRGDTLHRLSSDHLEYEGHHLGTPCCMSGTFRMANML